MFVLIYMNETIK